MSENNSNVVGIDGNPIPAAQQEPQQLNVAYSGYTLAVIVADASALINSITKITMGGVNPQLVHAVIDTTTSLMVMLSVLAQESGLSEEAMSELVQAKLTAVNEARAKAQQAPN